MASTNKDTAKDTETSKDTTDSTKDEGKPGASTDGGKPGEKKDEKKGGPSLDETLKPMAGMMGLPANQMPEELTVMAGEAAETFEAELAGGARVVPKQDLPECVLRFIQACRDWTDSLGIDILCVLVDYLTAAVNTAFSLVSKFI